MRIIGIDPGTAITGFGIIEKYNNKIKLLDYGCIRTPAGLDMSMRLNQIAEDLSTIIQKWSPKHASIEKLYFKKNIKTGISVAQSRGVILHILAKKGVPQTELSPLEIKSQICGNGNADKKMIQKMVKIILGLNTTPQPDDAADAIAAALCLAHTK
ncbi:crossover junction endodeoxyribonuclease RuvC [Patescibacteria group bacterium]